MGTSNSYGGARTGLVPTWIDDAVPGAAVSPAQSATPTATVPGGAGPQIGQMPPSPASNDASAGAFRNARTNFTGFASGGGRAALGRALSHYVSGGTGGAANASRRVGASRAAAAGLLGVVRGFQTVGAAETFRQLNLAAYVGRPAPDAFLALMEVICPPGGAVDEAIARSAMLESVQELAKVGIGTIDTLTQDQLHEFFLDFVIRSIEGRVMADIGQRGIVVPDDIAAAQRTQDQLHDFIAGHTRGALAGRLNEAVRLDSRGLQQFVNSLYELAFELIAVAAEAEQ
jgi:hypothetical protein